MPEEKNKKEEKTEAGKEKKSKPENDKDNQSPKDDSNEDNEDDDEVGAENDEDEEQINLNDEDKKSQFNFIEQVLFLSINILGDLIELFDLTGVGAVFGSLVDFICGPLTLVYFWFKGAPNIIGKNAIAQAVELIPFIDLLPIRTVVTFLNMNPKYTKKFEDFIGKVTNNKELVEKVAKTVKKISNKGK